MEWIYFALIAYLLNAFVAVIDKQLLSQSVTKPTGYAFWIAVLSTPVLILIPFGVRWLDFNYFLISLASGTAFFFGLIFLYKSLKPSDLSVIATKVGAWGALSTLIFSGVILGEVLTDFDIPAFVLLVVGIFLLSRLGKSTLHYSIFAGVLIGFSSVLIKYIFNSSDFINGFFWTRIGFVLAALVVVFSKTIRADIVSFLKLSSQKSKFLLVFNKILASIASVSLQYSIQIGSVILVNALLGLQFVFIFFLAILLKGRIPAIRENMAGKILILKLCSVVLITIGFALLFV